MSENAVSFFSKCENSFQQVKIKTDGDLPFLSTDQFLKACNSYLEIYDLLGGGLTFAPIKSDVSGNINKIRKHADGTIGNENIFSIIKNEQSLEECTKAGSATDALLWLTRGLWMMYFFIEIVADGERVASVAFEKAYEKSLAKWIKFLRTFNLKLN